MNDVIPKGAILLYRNHGYTIYKFMDFYYLKGLGDTTFFFVNRQEFVDFVTAVFSAFFVDRRNKRHE